MIRMKNALAICIRTAAILAAGISSAVYGADTNTDLNYVAREGEKWAPYDHKLDIQPGSVFDFSNLLDNAKPAGLFGPIAVNPDGRLIFENRPDVPVRFWGANLVFSATQMSKSQADRVSQRFALQGYNTVRLHHFDRDVIRKGGKSYELDPEKLDKLDYLFAAMKKNGIYINIDLYSFRPFKAEDCPEFGKDFRQEIKALMPIYDSAFESWKKFAEALLNHVNPYTGMTWGNDPALICICPVNEDPLYGEIWRNREVATHWQAKYKQWKESLPEAERASEIASSFDRFVYHKQVETYLRAMAVIRATGAKGLGTGSQYQVLRATQMVRDYYDTVNVHAYWNDVKIPGKQWIEPLVSPQTSHLLTATFWWQRAYTARVFGKPLMLTELNYVYPSRYRCEGVVINAANGCMQDWSAAYQFDYAASNGTLDEGGSGGYFYSIATDPIITTGDRATALMYRRGDFNVADRAIAYLIDEEPAFTPKRVYEGIPQSLYQLGQICRVGTVTIAGQRKLTSDMVKRHNIVAVVSDKPVSTEKTAGLPVYLLGDDLHKRLMDQGAIPTGSIDVARKHFASTTGQITFDGEPGIFKAVSERSECFVLNEGQSAQGSCVSVENGKAFSSFVFTTVDNKSLRESNRILMLHLTDSLGTDAGFQDKDRHNWVVQGHRPHLIYKSTAKVMLKLDPREVTEVWAVAADGSRTRKIPQEKTNDGLLLNLTIAGDAGTAIAYEIVRK